MTNEINSFHMTTAFLGVISFLGFIFYAWFHLEQKAMQAKFSKILTTDNSSAIFYITPADGDGYQKLVMLNEKTKKRTTLSLHFDIAKRVKELKENGFTVAGAALLD